MGRSCSSRSVIPLLRLDGRSSDANVGGVSGYGAPGVGGSLSVRNTKIETFPAGLSSCGCRSFSDPLMAALFVKAKKLLRQLAAKSPTFDRLRLTFPRPLEERFERHTRPQRARQWSELLLVCLVAYDLFAFGDFNLLPDVAFWTTIIRIGIVTPASLVCIWLIRCDLPKRWRESAGVFLTSLCSISVAGFSLASGSPVAWEYLDAVILTVIFSNLLLQLRFPYACASSSINSVVFAWAVINSSAPPAIKLNMLMFMVASVVLSLIANFKLERESRRLYLHNLGQQTQGFQLRETNRYLELISNLDDVTGVANRRCLESRLAELCSHAAQTAKPIGLLMVDIDFFKSYNDRHGHLAGDEVLRTVATILRGHTRGDTDLVARYGGEEFAVISPGQDLAEIMAAGERIRSAVENASVAQGSSGFCSPVTVSIGAASLIPSLPDTAGVALVAEADAALYAAKQMGRNRVWPYTPAVGNADITTPSLLTKRIRAIDISAEAQRTPAIRLCAAGDGIWVVESAPSGPDEPPLRVTFTGARASESAFELWKAMTGLPSETNRHNLSIR